MDGVCLSELPEDVGVDNPVVHKQGVIRTLLLTHDIHSLRSVDVEVLDEVHYGLLPCHSQKCLNVLTWSCNLLLPNKVRTFQVNCLFNFIVMEIRK